MLPVRKCRCLLVRRGYSLRVFLLRDSELVGTGGFDTEGFCSRGYVRTPKADADERDRSPCVAANDVEHVASSSLATVVRRMRSVVVIFPQRTSTALRQCTTVGEWNDAGQTNNELQRCSSVFV